MSVVTGPFDVAYPVNFYSGGDTTKDAFGKHIQEIKRIYGIINAINADAISADEFQTKLNQHINDSNHHPNMTLPVSRITGDWPTSRITGNLDFSRITGNVPASRITGNFGTDRITGLENYVGNYVRSNIPNNGLTEWDISNQGYMGFFNEELTIQWGYKAIARSEWTENIMTASFTKSFKQYCLIVNVSLNVDIGNGSSSAVNVFPQTAGWTKSKFKFIIQTIGGDSQNWDSIRIYYIAIGK